MDSMLYWDAVKMWLLLMGGMLLAAFTLAMCLDAVISWLERNTRDDPS
jgi:hypothetical protein